MILSTRVCIYKITHNRPIRLCPAMYSMLFIMVPPRDIKGTIILRGHTFPTDLMQALSAFCAVCVCVRVSSVHFMCVCVCVCMCVYVFFCCCIFACLAMFSVRFLPCVYIGFVF